MPLTKLQFKPGIVNDITSYSAEGGFVDGDKIRFRLGFPEKIGGWEKSSANTYKGTARSIHNWAALDGSNYLAIGTNNKYYIEEGGTFNDITPLRGALQENVVTFEATNGSDIVTVTDVSHGAVEGDFVTFSGVNSDGLGAGGNITQTILEQEYQIVNVLDADTYTIQVSVTANANDTEDGTGEEVGAGGTVTTDAQYQINSGLNTTVGGTGWGAGLFGGVTTTAKQTTINEGGTFSNSDTTLTVTTSNPTHQIATDDVILVENELMLVTGVSSNNLTVVRAYAGTGASSNVNTANHGSSNAVTDAVSHADGTLVRLATGNSDSDDDFTGWGVASAGLKTTTELRIWSEDNFNEDLIINPRDGAIYYWTKANNLSTRAVEISNLAGASETPTIAKQILVSDQDGHVIAFGANLQGTTIQDPLLIRFSDQDNAADWDISSDTNTAGDLILGGGSEFIQAVKTKQAIIVFTDKTLHAMRFQGPPYTFGLEELSKNITIMGPNAAVAVEDAVYWMGKNAFYVYAGGRTQQLPCTVKDKVFLDLNEDEFEKVYAGVNSEFSEVIWFYPATGSFDNSNYVIYNYASGIWYYGTLARDVWHDRGLRRNPLAAGGGYLFNQETGFDDDGSAMSSFIESAPIDIGDGEKFTFIRRIIPDLTFTGSTALSSPSATFTVKARNFPGVNFSDTDTGTTTRTSTSPVEAFTEKLDVRVRGRSFALRVASDALGCKWKLGSPRVEIREDGKR